MTGPLKEVHLGDLVMKGNLTALAIVGFLGVTGFGPVGGGKMPISGTLLESLQLTSFSANAGQTQEDKSFEKLQEQIEDSGSFDAKSNAGDAHFSAKVLKLDRTGLSLRTVMTTKISNSTFESVTETRLEWSDLNGVQVEKSDIYDPAFCVSLLLKRPISLTTREVISGGVEEGDEQRMSIGVFFGKRSEANSFRDEILSLSQRLKLKLGETLIDTESLSGVASLDHLFESLKTVLAKPQDVEMSIGDSRFIMKTTVNVTKLDKEGFSWSFESKGSGGDIGPMTMNASYEVTWQDVSSVRIRHSTEPVKMEGVVLKLKRPMKFRLTGKIGEIDMPEGPAQSDIEIVFAKKDDLTQAYAALRGILLRHSFGGSFFEVSEEARAAETCVAAATVH